MVLRLALLLALAAASCAPSGPRVTAIDPATLPSRATWTVLVFFSPSCHCFMAHEARLRALYDAYGPRGVQFLVVDSEARGSPERDEAEARRRGYPFPIVQDRGAALADRLDAQYATYSVVLDEQGRIRYHGGIDSDHDRLHDDATFYLRDALDDLLAGRAPRLAESKTLGCALQRW
jgi:AhpC/TSA family protein